MAKVSNETKNVKSRVYWGHGWEFSEDIWAEHVFWFNFEGEVRYITNTYTRTNCAIRVSIN